MNTAISFKITPKKIDQDIRQVNHLIEDEDNPKYFYQRPKRDKLNYEVAPQNQKGPDYYNQYGPTEDEYYNSESRETYSDSNEDYPKVQKTARGVRKMSPEIQKISQDSSQISQDISRDSPEVGQFSDSTEDSQGDFYYSDEDENPEDSTVSTTEDSPNSEIETHLREKSVVEKWIPSNCSRSTRKASDRYSSSFVSNNTKDDLNEDTFLNPGEAEAVKRSSVFVGEDVTLCWIETITIKEDKSIQPPKKVVLREFTISFENSATIPEKYLDCGKLKGEVEPGCHKQDGKSGFFDVVDEDSKVSKLVNFTTISNKGNIEVRQHKNVRCAVGPVVTKNVIEFKDGSKNPKKRVEVKVSPRLRRMSEPGESCPSDQEKFDEVPSKAQNEREMPEVKDLLPEDKEKPDGKSNAFGRMTKKDDEGPDDENSYPERLDEINKIPEAYDGIDQNLERADEINKKPKEGSDGINKNPEEEPNLIDQTPEVRPHYISKRPKNQPVSKRPIELPTYTPTTLQESTSHDDRKNEVDKPTESTKPVEGSQIFKDDIGKESSTLNAENVGESEESCEGKLCESEGESTEYGSKDDESENNESKNDTSDDDKSVDDKLLDDKSKDDKSNDRPDKDANSRKALRPSSKNEVLTEESTTPQATEPKQGKEIEGVTSQIESCEGDSCEQCSGEDCLVDSQSVEDSTEEKSVADKSTKDSPTKDKSTTEDSVRMQTPTPETDDANSEGDSTNKELPADGIILAGRKPPVNNETPDNTSTGEDKGEKKNESCSGKNCSTEIDESRTGGSNRKKLPSEDRVNEDTFSLSDETGSGTRKPQINQESESESVSCEEDDCSSCSGEDCSTESEQSEIEGSLGPIEFPSEDDKEKSEADGTRASRKLTTELPSNEEEKPSKKDLVSSPTVRKSSSRNTPPSDPENLTSPLSDFQRSEPEKTSSRPLKDETDDPDRWEEDTTKRPKHILSHSLIREERLEKDMKCEHESCSTPLKGLSESLEDSKKFPEGGTESNEEGPESPVGRTEPSDGVSKPEGLQRFSKPPEGIPNSAEDTSESPEESSESPKSTTKSPEVTRSTDKLNSKIIPESTEPPAVISKSPKGASKSIGSLRSTESPEGSSESPESTTKSLEVTRSKDTTEPGIKSESTESPEDVSPEPDDVDYMTDTYSDEKEPTSQTPSFIKTKISPVEKQPRNINEGFDGDLQNRSTKEVPEKVPETTTEVSLIERTTVECSADDDECVSKIETSSSEPVSDDCDSADFQGCRRMSEKVNDSGRGEEVEEGKENVEEIENEKDNEDELVKENDEDKEDTENKEGQSKATTYNPEATENKTVPKSLSGKHGLGLRIKILLEHINENEERKNLVEIDKHLLLNEKAKEHDNNTIMNQIKALNNSVTAQTIKALLNCTTLEKLANKGINIEVDEATLIPKGKEDTKDLEPNELILSVEDKRPDDELDKVRRKRETNDEASSKNNDSSDAGEGNTMDANNIDVNVTKDDSTDATTISSDSNKHNSTDPNSTKENSIDPNSTEKNTTDASSNDNNFNETTTREANHIEANTNKNQSEIIKDYLADLKKDISTGVNHVISKLNNCTIPDCFQKSGDVNLLPISNILGIISDPKDSRLNLRDKRQAEDSNKDKYSFDKLDHWSNERIRRAAGGHRFRSLTEFTIFSES